MSTDSDVQEIIRNILKKYKEMSYLWNKKDPLYKNKDIRDKGFVKLLESFKILDPKYTLKGMKKKLENMLYNYRKEAKKIKISQQVGIEYIPTLWYYEAINFLPVDAEPHYQRMRRYPIKYENASISYVEGDTSRQSTSSDTSVACESIGIESKKEEVWMTEPEDMESTEEQPAMCEGEWEIHGKAIGLQLKDLNPRSLAICQKLISDTIYYAKMGRLTEDSYIALGY